MNPHLDLIGASKSFSETGICTLSNIFEERFANEVANFLDKEIMESWWCASLHPSSARGRDISRIDENLPFILETRGKLQERMGRGEFCYSFDRASDNHYESCYCKLCEVFRLIKSDSIKQLLSTISGQPISKPHVMFASRYRSGDFLSYHTDIGNGQIAFVFNLTRDWKPWYGGNLVFLEQDLLSVKRTISPKFNSVTLFRVPETGIPHYVEMVAYGVQAKRLAISGWFI